jgi:hypothetical protein
MAYDNIPIAPGVKFRHISSGEIYEIITVSNLDAPIEKRKKFPITVVYKRLSDNTIWSRPYSSWIDKFELVLWKECSNKTVGICTLHNIFCQYPHCEE